MPTTLTKIAVAAICFCLSSSIQAGRAYGADFIAAAGKGAYGLSLNYPGAGIKYYLSDNFALELKGQADADVKVGGLRLYDHFFTSDRLYLFWGLEADYIDYKGTASRGAGGAGELFCGFEYFISPAVSLQADFGPAYIYLKDRHDPVTVNGIEYVTNFAFTVYFGGLKSGEGNWLLY